MALDGTGPAILPVAPEGAEAVRVQAALRPDQPVEDDQTAVVIATSGSTGEPKGVLLSGAALQASADLTHAQLGGPGCWLLALPLTHIGGLQVVVRSLLAGVGPVTPRDGTAAAFVAATELLGHSATGRRYTSLVPTQLRRLLAAGPEAVDALAGYDAILVGGAAADPGLLAAARTRGITVVTTYGMSETSGGCVYEGRPLPGVRVRLATDRLPGARSTGPELIELSGPVLASGYRLRPDLTARHFADGWFTTSDLGQLTDDGHLVVAGRSDDMIVTGGQKVAPAAVEAVLATHADIADVAVLGAADPDWGQRVVAVVVLHADRHLTLAQVRAHVSSLMPRAAAPHELRVVEALPMLASGKLDRLAVGAALLSARGPGSVPPAGPGAASARGAVQPVAEH